MTVYAVWEFRFPVEAAQQGLSVAEDIWADMTTFDGYVGHEMVQDLDDAGHVLVIGEWTNRQRADQVLAEYAGQSECRAG